ncbi:MAG: 2-hydroxyacyl-CoA dehydratase [Anaerolineales bacterium]|nr:2-hydroxyacyl-CoA dehydratase [Anaerolineales bacterium]
MPAFFLPIPSRSQAIQAFKAQGGQIAAVLPIHAPRALLRAFNVLPVEVWGPPGVEASHGAAHLQSYVCSIVRNALSFLLTGGLDVVDYIVVPHACDSLQGLGSILIDFIQPRQPVFPIYLPRGRRQSDLDFLAAELRALYRRLDELSGRSPGEDALMLSIRADEQADDLLAGLYRERRRLPLTQLEFYRLVRAREYLPAESFAGLARDILARAAEGLSDVEGIPILLSGIVPEPLSLFEELETIGGYVVADDLACCGRRLYPSGQSQDPFRRLAERILGAPPDAMHGSPILARLARLLQQIESTGARGVVFYEVKFCEPELFDLPALRDGLAAMGIRSLVIEIDLNEGLSGQAQTRLQAFLETIA